MKFKTLTALALSFLTLTGCSGSNKICIGGILPLTGDYNFSGTEIKNGVNFAISKRPEILGKKVKFIVRNDKSEHIKNIDAYNRFAADKNICAIIGGGNSILSEDIAAVSQKNPLPIIVPTATLNSITEYGENIYRACFTDDVQGICMAKFALQDLKAKTAAVFYDMDNNYSVGLAKIFSDTFSKNGGKVLIEQMHPNLDNDFKVQLNKIKLVEPDVLFVPDYSYNAILIAKQARDMQINSVILGPDTFEELLDQSSDKNILEGIYFCTHYSSENPNPTVKNFVSGYKEKYDSIPSSFAALGYDATNILLDAIEKGKSTDMETILKSLTQINYSGVTGNIKFDANRNPIKDLTILKISAGKNNFLKVFNNNHAAF